MPIYEYECKACGRVDEVMQKVDAPAPESCSACANGPLVKLMSRTGFILKGGGWYVTDFRGGSNKPSTGASGSAGSASDSGDRSGSSASGSGTGSDSGSGSTENKASGGHGGGCHGGNCAG